MAEKSGRLPYVQVINGLKDSFVQKQDSADKQPSSSYRLCDEWHYKKFYPYKNHCCTKYQHKGHK